MVIGSVSKETQNVQIQDAFPLFHLGLGLAPMLEVALTQVSFSLSLLPFSLATSLSFSCCTHTHSKTKSVSLHADKESMLA